MTITQSDDVLDGMPHIAGTRIGVHHVVRAFKDRDIRSEEIASRVYPHLSQAEVEEALKYALDAPDEYRKHLENHREKKLEIKKQIAAGPDDSDIPDPSS